MKFTPKSEEELQTEQLAPPGTYPFTITSAEEKTSKKDQPMFKLAVTLHSEDGRDWFAYDYVSPGFMAHKLRHLCSGVGILDKYEAGTLEAHDLQGRQGFCDVIVQKGKGEFGPKNAIKDYLHGGTDKAAPAKGAPVAGGTGVEDDVPF